MTAKIEQHSNTWRGLPLIRNFTSLTSSEQREALFGYLFISPWMIGFLVFFLGPIIASFVLSFSRWDIVGEIQWVGFANYERIFTNDPSFRKSVQVTLTYAVFYLPLEVIFGIGLAVVMNQKVKAIGIFRTLFYMPYVVPKVAGALVWVWMLSARYGAVNTLLGWGGIEGPRWLESPRYVLPSIIIMSLWGVGGSAVIYLAGLQNIPEQLYEAATIDGANARQRFRYVTLPMLTPTIFFQIVLGLIGVFQTFTPAFIAAGQAGGPLQSGLFYMLYIYNKAFGASGAGSRMGYASALSWIITVFILIITVLIFRSSKYWVHYEAERQGR
ncbi:MAG: sugar ABC transporter permease [Anaerolineae bacterium]|nr:sugar ABC transporter permease [Anaerolineae bacterium]